MAAKPSASHDQQVIAAEDGSPAERMAYMDARLYTAAAKGDVITLRELISADDVLRQVTPQRNALLHIASQFGQLVSVQLILQFSSSSSLLQQPNRKGDTALHLAAREGHREVVKALIHGAKSLHPEIESDVKPDKAMMRTTNKTGGTALHEAVWYNHVQVVELLVKEDPDFTYGADSSGYTPLYIAAERGFGDLVKILIGNKSSSPAHSGILGRNALHAAVIRRDLGN